MCNNGCYDEISTLNSLSILSYQLVNFIDKTTENSSIDNNENNNKLLKESIQINEEKNLTNNDNIANDRNLSSISLWNLENSNNDRSQPLLSPSSIITPSSKSSSTSSLHQTEVTVLDQNQISHLSHLHSLYSTSSSAKTASVLSRTMLGNGVIPPGLLPPLDHYRLQLYNYAMVERLRCSQYHNAGSLSMCPPNYQNSPAAASVVNNPYGSRFALSMSLFHNRVFQPEEPKPQHSYIGLIAMAILSSPETKLVLSDIYQHILDNYPYFRSRGPGWRNSIRHNLSLNDCFIKAGRSANGKGHYWAIHPANLEDFKKGDFRRRKAQRKVRKHMGLAVDDEGTDSPSPPTLAVTPPPHPPNVVTGPFCPNSWAAAAVVASGTPTANVMANIYSQSRKRQFDVASLLAPDEDNNHHAVRFLQSESHFFKGPVTKRLSLPSSNEIDEYIDVVASDVEENIRQITNKVPSISQQNKDENNCFNSVPLTISSSALIENKEIQSINDETPIDSPCSNQMDDDISGPRTGSSSPTAWQGLIQQWPNNFNSIGIDGSNSSLSATTMDPRVLERYYGQYMAAAAAQQIAVTKKTVVVGNLLNSNNHSLISRETILNADIKNDNDILIHSHKNKTIVIENNNRNFNSTEGIGTSGGPLEMTMRSHSQHHQDNSEHQHQRIEFLALQTNDS